VFITKKRLSRFFKLAGFGKMPLLPYILNIEPGNICNLHCPLCPTGSGDKSLSKGFLSLELFKKVFDQLSTSIESINLYSWGEPLLNKDLIKIIRYAKSMNGKVKITTSSNLNIQDNKLLADLVVSGIDEVIISCDGIDQDSYGRYRQGGDFTLVIQNMKEMARIRKESGAKTKLVWNFLVFKHNEEMVEKAQKMAGEIGVDFRIGLMRTSMKDEILKPHSEAIQKDISWIPDRQEYCAYDKVKLTAKKVISTCRKPWQEITINWDGRVFPCCAVYGDNFSLGDASRERIADIWNGHDYVQARKEILRKEVRPLTVCGLCRDNGFMHM